MRYGPWLEVNFSKPDWIRFLDVFEYRNKDGRQAPGSYYAAFFNWSAASAIRLKSDHPAYAMLASPAQPEPAPDPAPAPAPAQQALTLASLDARLRALEDWRAAAGTR